MAINTVITLDRVNNAAELVATLNRIFAYVGVDPAEITTSNNSGEALTVKVIVGVLTDGSKVYSIRIE